VSDIIRDNYQFDSLEDLHYLAASYQIASKIRGLSHDLVLKQVHEEFARLVPDMSLYRIVDISSLQIGTTKVKSDLPKKIIVPSTVDDQTIIGAASYRVNGRVPCLAYKARNGFALWRSS